MKGSKKMIWSLLVLLGFFEAVSKWYRPRMGLVKRGFRENKIFKFKGKTTSKTSNKAKD
jgi:hypothetical protein